MRREALLAVGLALVREPLVPERVRRAHHDPVRLDEPLFVGAPDDAALAHERVLEQHVLDLERRHPDAADFQEVVAAPAAGRPAVHEGTVDTLGLTTIVDDPLLRPLMRLRDRLEGGGPGVRGADALVATGTLPDGEPGPLELEVRFTAADQVEIAALGPLGAGEALLRSFEPGTPIEAHGATLRLEPAVDPVGRTWRVTLLSEADALERVMDATNVQETDRNSGVLRITYDDTDPERAARTVNALCRRYLARNLAAAQRRASETVGYIERSLEEQRADLAAAAPAHDIGDFRDRHESALDALGARVESRCPLEPTVAAALAERHARATTAPERAWTGRLIEAFDPLHVLRTSGFPAGFDSDR